MKSVQTYKRELVSLIGTSFLFVMVFMVTEPILTLYMREVGATELEVGLILAISSLTGIACVPFGLASNRYGKKIVIQIALVSEFLALLFLSLVPAPAWFYPVFVMWAIPMAAYWSSAAALASDLAPQGKRGEIMAQYFTAFGLAMFFGPLLCSFLIQYMSYRQVFLTLLPFPLVGLAIFLKSGPAERRNEPDDPSKNEGANILDSFRRILRARNVKTLNAIAILSSIPLNIFATLFSIYAKETLLILPSLISLLFTARGGVNALIRMPTGWISDQINSRKKPLMVSTGFFITAFLIISITGSYPLLMLGMVIFGLGWGMRAALESTFVTEYVDVKDRSLALSIYLMMANIGHLLGSVLAGVLTITLPATEILKISIAFNSLALLLFILLVKEDKP